VTIAGCAPRASRLRRNKAGTVSGSGSTVTKSGP
jgi:hypothetical protein